MKLGGKISRSPKHVNDITGTDPLYLRKLGGAKSKKLEKNEVFLTYEGVIGSS